MKKEKNKYINIILKNIFIKWKQIFVRNIIDCSIKKWYIYFAACRKLRKVDFL